MRTTLQRSPKTERQSLFFRDLASPVSTHRGGAAGGRFATPGQAAAVSALWRENFGSSDPPPPPVFTLEDRVNFSPEPGLADLPASPELKIEARTPPPALGYLSSPSPLKNRAEASNSGAVGGGLHVFQQQSPGSSSWRSPAKGGGGGELDDKGKGSPVDGVIHPGPLITLPPPREVARPELQRNNLPVGGRDEEEWVTVYGFSPGDTNLVLREFEKCGAILKHIPGPRVANWMHILYQSRYDAQKAIAKNGVQLNSILIIGVKAMDPQQRQYLNESLNSNYHGGFMVSLPSQSTAGMSSAARGLSGPPSRPYHLQNGSITTTNDSEHRTRAIASPTKSVVSKVVDLMFSI
ncbi:nuclear pore complex protein NUP35 [Phoenix dactylifera]|uniref:Nuclear pore complex protein NUP35 n=1 Tax=Phoenix dactylifera TaxID=42345 RepID=A0A8B7C4K9_PHODC|nr:nuclear pore complex protein NUP35 [Phoenix dactylifera]